jgi:FAD:protein FMN transferase
MEWWKRSLGTFDITVGPLLKAWGFWGGDPRVPCIGELSQAKARVGMDAVELFHEQRSVRFKKPGMELDFGGLAKGYAAEAAARVALRAGAKSALVNLGGSSLYALSGIRDPSTSPKRQAFGAQHLLPIGQWPVLLGGVNLAGNEAQYLLLTPGWSLSSSASSEQFLRTSAGRILSHVVDPRTGYPAEGPCSAFVLTRSGVSGEAIAKPLLLLNDSDRHAFARSTKIPWASVQRPNSHAWEPRRSAVFLAPVS